MTLVTTLYVGLFYVATIILIVGIALRIKKYAQTPAPLKIPTMPAPRTETGVVMRIFREVVFFESLFRSNKWTWLFGYLFHFGMLLQDAIPATPPENSYTDTVNNVTRRDYSVEYRP